MLSFLCRNANHSAKFINGAVPCLSNIFKRNFCALQNGLSTVRGCEFSPRKNLEISTCRVMEFCSEGNIKFPGRARIDRKQTRLLSIFSGKYYPDKKAQPNSDVAKDPSSAHNGSNKDRENLIKKGIILLSFIIGSGLLYKLLDKDKSVKKVAEKDIKKKLRQSKAHSKVPPNSADIPDEVPYLLIGGGTASFSAFRAIKSLEPKAKVLVVSNEPHFPYMRPPLSKEMFYNEDRKSIENLEFKQWNGTERSLFYEPGDFYTSCSDLVQIENGGVSVARGWTVTNLDVINKTATLDDGKLIKYEKCLIATGARPKNLPIFEKADPKLQEKVSLYRSIKDFEELDYVIENGARSIAIVGGGFLGSELACALSRRGNEKNLKITQIFKEEGNMGKVLPKYLSDWTTMKVKEEGVTVFAKSTVEKAELENNNVVLHINNGESISVDHVIVAVGVEPNTGLAETSKLELDKVNGGFLVNAELEARKDLFVAGDCACFYDVKLGRRRVEHHDHAVVSGRLAGENMTGAGKPYWHQSMFWSDLGPDVGYEAIGIVDSTLSTVGVYAKDSEDPDKATSDSGNSSVVKENENITTPLTTPTSGEDYVKGVIFYLRDGIVVGIVLWNIFNKMAVARQVLKDEKRYEDLNEVAKLFNIHE